MRLRIPFLRMIEPELGHRPPDPGDIVFNLVFGIIMSLAVIGGAIFGGWYVWNKIEESGAVGAAGGDDDDGKPAKAEEWSGRRPFTCNSGTHKVVGTRAKLDETAVKAAGGCKLTLVDVEIVAPTAIVALGSAKVVVEGGRLEGTDEAIVAMGSALVTLEKTEVVGKTRTGGSGKISGL